MRVLDPVDQQNRDFLPILLVILRIIEDRTLLYRDSLTAIQVPQNLINDTLSDIT